MTTPVVSIVCSTFERSARLRSLFEAIEAQSHDHDAFEVVVVDDGSRDETPQVLDELAANASFAVRRVTFETNQGAARGRNAGWRAATAPIVAFTDDDCAPTPDWLVAGLDAIEATGAQIVVGQTLPNPSQAENNGPFSRTQRINEASGTRFLHTCNIFYRRDALESVDGFDERFSTKGGEDTDLGWRVLDRGGEVAYAPEALVFHDISKGSFKAALREASRWTDIPLVKAYHPERSRPVWVHRVFWKKTHEYVLLAIGSAIAAAALRNVVPLVGALPWLNYRLRKSPVDRTGKLRRFRYLPHAFLIDTIEVTTMVRGSVRGRTFLL